MEDQIKDIIVNGEIYLKRGPEVFDSKSYVEKYDEEIGDLEFELSKENPNFNYTDILDGYKELKKEAEALRGKLDYHGTESFWQLFTEDGKRVTLYECEEYYEKTKSYNSVDKMKQEFVKLSEFLEKATFVGREFERTKPITSFTVNPDYSYCRHSQEEKHIVLYATQELFLIKMIDPLLNPKERYALINSRYTLDGNYEFFGPVYDEYKDKTKVYREIVEQIENYDKGKRKK